jgi:hypothetical protein
MKRNHSRAWSTPLAAAATRPTGFFWMDVRLFWPAAFCGAVATLAPDVRVQILFWAVFTAIVLLGWRLWRKNPWLIDELQAHFALPDGGPADAYEVVE